MSSGWRKVIRWLPDLAPWRALVLDRYGLVQSIYESPGSATLVPCPSCVAALGANYLTACERGITAETVEEQSAGAGLRRALAPGGKPFNFHYEREIQGEPRLFQFSALPLGGNADGALVLHTDLTASVPVDHARPETAARDHPRSGFTSTAHVLVDRDGRLINASPQFLALVGARSQADVRGCLTPYWIAEDHRPLFVQMLASAWRTQQRHYVELALEVERGNRVTMMLAAQRINGAREPRIAIFCHDVRLRAIEAADARYQAVVESRSELICRCSADTRLTFANEAFCRFFGTTCAQAIGRPLLDVLPATIRSALRDLMTAATGSMKKKRAALKTSTATGEVRWLNWTVQPIRFADGSVEVHVVGRDDSRRRLAEAELRSTQRKVQDLTSRLVRAHEVVCRRIAREMHDGFSQLIAAHTIELAVLARDFGGQNEELRKRIEKLERDATAIGDCIRMFSHQLHPAVVDRLGLSTAIQSLCRQVATQAGLQVNVSVAPSMDELPLETSYSLYRIAQEMIANIVRHARARQFEVHVERIDGRIRMRFEDDGRGFERDKVHRRGALGLLSIEERVSYFRGNLKIESAPGRGTRAVIELPMPPAK